MAATELFCPECQAYVTTLFPDFMRLEYQCPNCEIVIPRLDLVERKRGSLMLAGADDRFPIVRLEAGTFNGGTTGLISNVTVPQGATLLVFTVEGLATGIGVTWANVVWNGITLSQVAPHGDGVVRTNVHMVSNSNAGNSNITITPTDADVDSIVAFATVLIGALKSSTELDVFDKTSETGDSGSGSKVVNNLLTSATTADKEIMLAYAVNYILSTTAGTWASYVNPARSVLNTTCANPFRVSEGWRNLTGKARYNAPHTYLVDNFWLGQACTLVAQ